MSMTYLVGPTLDMKTSSGNAFSWKNYKEPTLSAYYSIGLVIMSRGQESASNGSVE